MADMEQFGSFQLMKKLASGGMGEIFEAKSVKMPADAPPFALKRILPHLAQDPSFIKLFINEAKIIANLSHPNLIRIHDFGKEQDSYYMTMDLVHGVNLDLVMIKAPLQRKHWTLECGVEVVRQLLEGIGYAHGATDRNGQPLNIVHLDINPHNVMLAPDGIVKLLDFGISHASYNQDQKSHNSLRGTYAYMSPEQCREQSVDGRSDLFSIGVILYELCLLTDLFKRHPSEFLILKAITDGDIPKPSSIDPNFPPALEAVILRALAVDPAQRFQSAKEFRQALGQAAKQAGLNLGVQTLSAGMTALFPTLATFAKPQSDATPSEIKRTGSLSDQLFGDMDLERQTTNVHSPIESTIGQAVGAGTSFVERARQSGAYGVRSSSDPTPTPSAITMTPGTSALPGQLPTASGNFATVNVPTGVHPEAYFEDLAQQKRKQIYKVSGVLSVVLLVLVFIAYGMKANLSTDLVGSPEYQPTSGKVYIYSDPEGAKVFVDKQEMPTPTPASLDNLPLGKPLMIEVVKSRYQTHTTQVTLSPDSPMDAVVVELKHRSY